MYQFTISVLVKFIPQFEGIANESLLVNGQLLFRINKKKSKVKPVQADNSAADDDQADCETRKSDADDDSSWNKALISFESTAWGYVIDIHEQLLFTANCKLNFQVQIHLQEWQFDIY